MIVLAGLVQASTAASGDESFSGLIVTSGRSGDRQVLSSVVIARGVFDGVGRIVEVPNLPGDPDNVSRDDLVFTGGSLHLVSTTSDVSFSVDPRSCRFEAVLTQTGEIVRGTGDFAGASGSSSATVTARGLLARTAGGCSSEQVPLNEVDTITSTGSLSF
jgi:hypothetical protein